VHRDPDRFVETYWTNTKSRAGILQGTLPKKVKMAITGLSQGRRCHQSKRYRLGTAEIESIMISHPAVAESAAVAVHMI